MTYQEPERPESPGTKDAEEHAADPQKAVDNQSLSSGQSWCEKVQFACSLISPMASGGVLLLSKDIYVLELAADVRLMGIAGTLLAIWGPCTNILVGYCMNRDPFGRCFPRSTWGRRAPWFLTHLLAASVVTAAIYMPPWWGSTFLCWWYFGWGFVLCWLLSVLFNCFESCRAEMYPTKEERSEVETACKITSGAGGGLGSLPQLAVAASVTGLSMTLAGAGFFVIGLLSLVSVPVLRRAQQTYEPNFTNSFLKDCRELLRQPAFVHLCAYRFMDAFINTLMLSGILYYLTVVGQKTGATRSFFYALIAMSLGGSAIVLMPVWTIFFRKRRESVNPSSVCGRVMMLGLAAPVCLFLGRLLVPKPWELVIYVFVLSASLTGQTYWRALALCWIVDEDCQAKVGRRRESVFVGCVSLISSLGRAAAMGVIFFGLAMAGLNTTACSTHCFGEKAGQARDVCRSACEVRNTRQDPSVTLCLNLIYMAIIPLGQALAALLCCSFPIRGERLALLYERQAALFINSSPSSLQVSSLALAPPPTPLGK